MSKYRVSKEEIISLRKLVPVGVMYAKQLLEISKGVLGKARKIYLEEEITRLAQNTTLGEVKVGELFFENDYNSQLTLDAIHDHEFAENFHAARTKARSKDFDSFDRWIEVVKKEGLMRSLQAKDFDSVFKVIYDTGYTTFAEVLIEAHIFLHNKEIFLRKVEEDKLIEAVAEIKADDIYQSAMEQFKVTVLLNPEFLKVVERLRKGILGD